MKKVFGFMLLVVGVSATLSAATVPEIDPASAGSALALLAGSVLVIRGRKK